MSAAAGDRGGLGWRSAPMRFWIIAIVNVVILAIPPLTTSFGLGGDPATGPATVALPLGLVIIAVQLRHSLAFARGERPRGAVWTLCALAVLVYLPLPWFRWNWMFAQTALMASAPMLLRGRLAAVAVVAPVLGTDLALVMDYAGELPASTLIYWVAYTTFSLFAMTAALYGSARLVRILEELHTTRAELATIAVGRERLRVSRDLHDLLGQSLSAVSLKGDLAIRLLERDPEAAQAEIQGLTGVARDALRGVRAVTRDQHAVSLATEADGAAALLRAAGIQVQLDLRLPALSAAREQVLAWAVREGTTNVLRHSQASTCSITANRHDGTLWLEIVNDGAPAPADAGSGLDGLAERARALTGSVSHEHTPDGRFRLLVKLPEAAP